MKLMYLTKQRTRMSFCPCCSQAGVVQGHKMAIFLHVPEYFLRKACIKCVFSVILLSKLNLNYVRVYDVDPLRFPANWDSYRSYAGYFFALQKIKAEKIIK